MAAMTPQTPENRAGPDWTTPRPIDAAYWVVPGRLLVGEHPGSRSRAQSMERLRRFLEAGITCFIDLTEPDESPAYEMLLPFETPSGRRVEYLREPIPDHGVPADRARVLKDGFMAMTASAASIGSSEAAPSTTALAFDATARATSLAVTKDRKSVV